MTKTVLRLYDYLAAHRNLRLLSFLMVTGLLAVLVVRLDYKEDISDFLPLDEAQQRELQQWQDASGANRVVAVFQMADTTRRDPDVLVEAVDRFVEDLERLDTARWVQHVTAEADLSVVQQTASFVYRNMPYFLTAADYSRMDSLLARPDFVASQLQQDRQLLMLPAASLLSENIQRDPLNLFTPVVSLLRDVPPPMRYAVYADHIFSPDSSRAIVMLDSPFGASETEQNARLLELLGSVGHDSQVSVRFTGGPVIAVGNARQIKSDSLLSVSIAVVLILLLLWFSFRRLRPLVLIVLSIGWGWLFAMGCLSLVHREVSIIVMGISSVIVGIAVNYPLHLLSHLAHTPDVRQSLREIAKPLVVGNITTVGAFLALVPLQSVALRDLGLFSSFLLMGTILFVLVWMPFLVDARREDLVAPGEAPEAHGERSAPSAPAPYAPRLAAYAPLLAAALVLLTLFFGYHSLDTSFDADMNHINYLSPQQRADMDYFQQQMQQPADTVLTERLARRFLCAPDEQQRRISQWETWTSQHADSLLAVLSREGQRAGFAPGSFDEFAAILKAPCPPRDEAYFAPLTTTVLSSVKQPLKSMTQLLASQLSDNFNYIGWACSLIVFFFLWFSFRSLALAVLAFLPMAVSWLWILGIMSLLGIQFNIVNVILATFIFGQGDDYTIFMTEGARYEYVHRRSVLASYRRAILLSALIMFIGIGSLIVARHPALHSLAEVTVVGMFSVVLMACILPPLAFRWLVGVRNVFKRKKI